MPSLNCSSPRRRRNAASRPTKFKVLGDHKAFLTRIKKSLYYGKFPVSNQLSLPITELAAELYTDVKSGYSLDRLDLEEAAALTRNASVSPCSLVLALFYLERLKTCNPDYLHRVAPSELFFVSMLVASKFLQDDGEEDEVLNDDWANAAGIDVKVLNQFERDFLQAIDWEVFVSDQAFWNQLCELEEAIALKEGRRRGWFTYTDLDILMDSMDLSKLAQTLIAVSAICLSSYTASVLTLIGSAFLVSQIPGSSLNQPLAPVIPPLLSDPTADQEFSPHEGPLVDSHDAEFILSVLSCANSSDEYNCVTPYIETRMHPSNWITDILSSSWHWLNDNYLHWYTVNDYWLDEHFTNDIQLKRIGIDQNFKFMFFINKSWIWESENFWKDLRVWLLANRNHQRAHFLYMPVTSHY